MAFDVDEVLVAGTGHVYLAPVGSTEPTDTTTAWDAAWKELGYTTDDGVTKTPGKTITDIPAWQSFYPVRRIVSGRDFSVAFSLLQWNRDTLAAAYDGGTWATTGGIHTFTPPDAGSLYQRALGIEATDGSKIYRWVFRQGIISDVGGIQLVRTGAAAIPITFGITAESGTDPFKFVTDDPAFAAA